MHDTSDGWHGLISGLTDEELTRYGEIAVDQKQREWRLGWLQVVLVLAAAGLVIWVIRLAALGHFDRSGLMILGLSAALGYWPYRKAKARWLWETHFEAVRAEQTRRHGRCVKTANLN